jgi:hypothetical protein
LPDMKNKIFVIIVVRSSPSRSHDTDYIDQPASTATV